MSMKRACLTYFVRAGSMRTLTLYSLKNLRGVEKDIEEEEEERANRRETFPVT